MDPQPLRIHIGKDNPDLILYKGALLGRLTEFRLRAGTDQLLVTDYTVVGPFPDILYPTPENALSNSAYPLRIGVGRTADDIVVTYLSRPISWIKDVFLHMLAHSITGEHKRQLRLTVYTIPAELREALLDLGVEVIIEPKEKTDGLQGV